MNPKRQRRRRVQPLVAWRAIRELFRDPERTDQVFVIIRALSGRTLERSYRRVQADEAGRRTLDEDRSLVDTLSDLDRLRALPEDTVGRAYARFMDEQGLTARGLVEASRNEDRDEDMDPRMRRLGERLRDMHDLWHVTAGYGRDLLGEDALLAFSYAQTRNRGVGLIVLVAAFELWRYGMKDGLRTVRDAYRRGRRAAFLPAADWEALLQLPLSTVRRQLRLGEPPQYTPVYQDAEAPGAARQAA